MAQNIWTDLGQPSGQPPSYIQTKLTSQAYIGRLNNLLTTCYSGVSGDICPSLSPDEQGIYTLMYEMDYYTTKITQVLNGTAPGQQVVQLADGDSRITFVNPVGQAQVFRDLKSQLYNELTMQVAAYRQQRSQPSSVDYPTIVNGVLGGYGSFNGPIGGGGPYNYYRS